MYSGYTINVFVGGFPQNRDRIGNGPLPSISRLANDAEGWHRHDGGTRRNVSKIVPPLRSATGGARARALTIELVIIYYT